MPRMMARALRIQRGSISADVVECGAALRGGCCGEEKLRLRGGGMSLVCRVQHLMRGREWRWCE
jgi:hypothetical protein